MLYSLFFAEMLFFPPTLVAAHPNRETLLCAPDLEYRGATRHPGVALQDLPTTFDLGGDLDPAVVARLDDTLQWALERTDAPGITAAIAIPGEGTWSATTGLTTTEPEQRLTDDSVFWWASGGKLFTAAVTLQLVAEEKLSLDQTIDRWFPDYPQARRITIEHLLTHTGGVFSFQQDPAFRARSRYHTPNELIALSAAQGADFCPGEFWSYSNTGYVMLAQIIEAVESQSFADVVTRRIIEPLNLTQTQVLAPAAHPQNLAVGHLNGDPNPDFEPSLPFGAGNIVASAEDMVTVLAALLAGNLYPRSLLADSLQPLYPMFDSGTYYGRGIMLYAVEQDDTVVNWLGHSGGTPDVKAVVAYDRDHHRFVAVAANAGVPVEAIALRLLSASQTPASR